jgi:hypothetical protein
MNTTFLRFAVASSVLTLTACAGPTAPTETGPATFQITNPDALLRASSDAVGSIGNFRVKPGPDDDGAIHAVVGDPVTVNANDYRQSYPGATLYLIANWGDGGGNQRVSCGPCRLAHAYGRAGAVQTGNDRGRRDHAPVSAQSPETQVVTVIVTGAPEKPEPLPP